LLKFSEREKSPEFFELKIEIIIFRKRREKMKVKAVNLEKDEIILTHRGETYIGTYSAYVGKWEEEFSPGERFRKKLCVWEQAEGKNPGRLEPAWGEEMVEELIKRGKKILNGK
jgi:hypothetical protein